MRTKAVLIFLSFILIGGLIGFFWGDSILAWSLEQSLQTIIGAKVEVYRFHLDLIKLAVRIDNLKITNPADTWKNLIDAKNISFKLSAGPLCEGKTVIDEIVIEDLIFNTPRRTDGKLKQPLLPGPLGNAQAKLQQSIAKMPVLRPETIAQHLDAGKLTASYQFKTDLSASKIKTEIEYAGAKWRANLKELENIKAELNKLDLKVTELKNFRSRNPLEINEKLKLIKETQVSINDFKNKIENTGVLFQKDNQIISESIKNLKREAEDDYRSLLKMAQIPDFGSINYTEALLGKPLLNASTIFLKLTDDLQKSLPVRVENPPKEEHRRGGQEITFPGRKTYPRFLIKKITVSGKGTPSSFLDGYYAKGTLTGITSEPPIYGLPITASFFGKAPNQAFLELSGQINHISPSFQDQVNLKLGKLPLPVIELPKSEYWPAKIVSGELEINADFRMTPGAMNLKVLITGNNIKSIFTDKQNANDLVMEIIRNTLTDLEQVTVDYQLKRIAERLEMKISSNLNDLISNRIKESIDRKIAEFTGELRAKVDAKLLEQQQKLEAVKLRYQQEVTAKLNEVRMQLKREEEIWQAKKKELEANVRQEINKLKLK